MISESGSFKKALALLTAVIMIMVNCVPVIAEDSFRSARVADVAGDVRVTRAGGEKSFAAFEGMSLTEGDGIVTGPGARVTLEIDEDKEVKLGENTQLNMSELSGLIQSEDDKTGLGLVVGKLWANIKKKLNIRAKFEVKTPTAVMGVRGTKFYVTREGGSTSVGVLEGNLVATSFSMAEQQPGVPPGQVVIQINLAQNQSTTIDDATRTTGQTQVVAVTLESLDRFVLEAIKETPQGIDPKLLENIERVIEQKKAEEEKKKQEEKPVEKPAPVINNTAVTTGGNTTNQTTTSGGSGGGSSTVYVTGVSLSSSLIEMVAGNEQTLTAAVTPSNATNPTVTWFTYNSSVATVSGSGKVTAVAEGSTAIRVTTSDGGYKAYCNIVVLPAGTQISVSGIAISPAAKGLGIGESYTLTAVISPQNATNKTVTWSTYNPNIASVDASGKVTGIAAGSTAIKAKTADGGFEATCTVNVGTDYIDAYAYKSSMSVTGSIYSADTVDLKIKDYAGNTIGTWSGGTIEGNALKFFYGKDDIIPGIYTYEVTPKKSGSITEPATTGKVYGLAGVNLTASGFSPTVTYTVYGADRTRVTIENSDLSIARYGVGRNASTSWEIYPGDITNTTIECFPDLSELPVGTYEMVISFKEDENNTFGIVVGYVYVTASGVTVTAN